MISWNKIKHWIAQTLCWWWAIVMVAMTSYIIGDWIVTEEPPIGDSYCVEKAYTMDPGIRAGTFVTSDKQMVSFYVLRVVKTADATDTEPPKHKICIAQRRYPNGIFENCVSDDYFFAWVRAMDGYYSTEARYGYYR